MYDFEKYHKRGTRSTGGAGRVPLPKPKSVYSHDRSKEVVFKVVSFGKSIRAAKQCMEYIAKNSEHLMEPEFLMDDMGSEHSVENINDILEQWNLKPNSENLSKAALNVSLDEFKVMPEKDRLDRRQTMHSVISFPKWMDPTKEEMKEIARQAMDPFFKAGHESVYVPHIEADHHHVHIITQVESLYTGKQLRINRNDIQAIRERIAEIGRREGYDLQATRRTPSLKEMIHREEGLKKKIDEREQSIKDIEAVINNGGKLGVFDQRRIDRSLNAARRDLKRERDNTLMKAERQRQRRLDPSATLKKMEKLDHQLEQLKSGKSIKENLEGLKNVLHSQNTQQLNQQKRLHIEMTKAFNRLPDGVKEKTKFEASPIGKKIANDISKIGSSLLERQAPTWYSRYGVTYEQARTNIIAETNPPKPTPVSLPVLSKDLEQYFDDFFVQKYANADDAKKRFLEMAAEAKKTAYWYVNNRPETFGVYRPDSIVKLYEQRGRRTFRLPSEWLAQASLSISNIENSTPGGQRQMRHRAATRIRQLHNERLKLEVDLLPANDFLRLNNMETVKKVGLWSKARAFFQKHSEQKTSRDHPLGHSSALSAQNMGPMTERQVKANMEAIKKASIGTERTIKPFSFVKGR